MLNFNKSAAAKAFLLASGVAGLAGQSGCVDPRDAKIKALEKQVQELEEGPKTQRKSSWHTKQQSYRIAYDPLFQTLRHQKLDKYYDYSYDDTGRLPSKEYEGYTFNPGMTEPAQDDSSIFGFTSKRGNKTVNRTRQSSINAGDHSINSSSKGDINADDHSVNLSEDGHVVGGDFSFNISDDGDTKGGKCSFNVSGFGNAKGEEGSINFARCGTASGGLINIDKNGITHKLKDQGQLNTIIEELKTKQIDLKKKNLWRASLEIDVVLTFLERPGLLTSGSKTRL